MLKNWRWPCRTVQIFESIQLASLAYLARGQSGRNRIRSLCAREKTHLAGADLVLGLFEPGDPFVPKDVDKRVDFADDNLPAAD